MMQEGKRLGIYRFAILPLFLEQTIEFVRSGKIFTLYTKVTMGLDRYKAKNMERDLKFNGLLKSIYYPQRYARKDFFSLFLCCYLRISLRLDIN